MLVSLHARQIAARDGNVKQHLKFRLQLSINYLYMSIVFIYRFSDGESSVWTCMPKWTCKLRLSGSCLQGNDALKNRSDWCASSMLVKNVCSKINFWQAYSGKVSCKWLQKLFINRPLSDLPVSSYWSAYELIASADIQSLPMTISDAVDKQFSK